MFMIDVVGGTAFFRARNNLRAKLHSFFKSDITIRTKILHFRNSDIEISTRIAKKIAKIPDFIGVFILIV